MGIALLAMNGLQHWMDRWFSPTPTRHTAQPSGTQTHRTVGKVVPLHPTDRPAVQRRHAPTAQRPIAAPAVRMRRLSESGQRPEQAGRMVISGRMADVCAELDRLAQREAAQCAAQSARSARSTRH